MKSRTIRRVVWAAECPGGVGCCWRARATVPPSLPRIARGLPIRRFRRCGHAPMPWSRTAPSGEAGTGGQGPGRRSWKPTPKPRRASALVQYFDKSRMEINNPNGDKSSPFYVTNGLLTVELISGQMQVGDQALVDRAPADVPLASDGDDPTAPTYASFRAVSSYPGHGYADPPYDRDLAYAVAHDHRAGQVGRQDAYVTGHPHGHLHQRAQHPQRLLGLPQRNRPGAGERANPDRRADQPLVLCQRPADQRPLLGAGRSAGSIRTC